MQLGVVDVERWRQPQAALECLGETIRISTMVLPLLPRLLLLVTLLLLLLLQSCSHFMLPLCLFVRLLLLRWLQYFPQLLHKLLLLLLVLPPLRLLPS